MDIFGKEAIVEIPAQITPEQKAWLDMMVRKGKIAVPPGGTLPEGSVISIFMRTLLWNSEEQGQTLDMVTREGLEELRSQRNLVELKVQLAQDQKTWLEKMAASSKVVSEKNTGSRLWTITWTRNLSSWLAQAA